MKINNLFLILTILSLVGCRPTTKDREKAVLQEFDREFGTNTTIKIWYLTKEFIEKDGFERTDFDFFVQNYKGVYHVNTDGRSFRKELIFPNPQ
jgi:hypothetical protein